jgi:hypothetical protein
MISDNVLHNIQIIFKQLEEKNIELSYYAAEDGIFMNNQRKKYYSCYNRTAVQQECFL